MTETNTAPKPNNGDFKISFWKKYPKWVYYTAVGLIVAIIVVLGVVFGYFLPRKERIENCQGVCLAQNLMCTFSCSGQNSDCSFKCPFNDTECKDKCNNYSPNCNIKCESSLNPCLDRCNSL